ncbi:sporulation protein YabP [uncultured Clostridium sp.]|uniref:sporulation protein YabP n=1 Tax=uncultured Clostridium sp. TaxID=59620 RepID=UPI0025CBAA28|nr:sporulation protein YabP [uncultured Clostridium sp.]
MEEIKKSNISLENRKKLILTGVIEVIEFSDKEITLKTNLGNLNVKGENLKIDKLDVQNGDVIIRGVVSSMIYTNKTIKKKRPNIIKRIFAGE